MIEKKAVTEFDIHELIAKRWSGRAYDPSRPVDNQLIGQLIEAARWAPSCFGDEPWRFVICNKSTNAEAWHKAFECLVEGNQAWAKDAEVLVLICCNTVLTTNGKPNAYGKYDSGAAMMSLSIQATELGLMVHQMGGYKADKAREVFSVPEQFDTVAMATIGYQLPADKLPEDVKERELAERSRAEMSTHFFADTWGQSFDA